MHADTKSYFSVEKLLLFGILYAASDVDSSEGN